MPLSVLNDLLHTGTTCCLQLSDDTGATDTNVPRCINCCFLPAIISRAPQKKKSSSLEDLQSESLEKVGLFLITISAV